MVGERFESAMTDKRPLTSKRSTWEDLQFSRSVRVSMAQSFFFGLDMSIAELCQLPLRGIELAQRISFFKTMASSSWAPKTTPSMEFLLSEDMLRKSFCVDAILCSIPNKEYAGRE
jgi:hypothetical protein